MDIKNRIEAVQARMAAAARKAGRDPEAVRLVTVTKTVGVDRVRQAIEAGAAILGENYVQEAMDKFEALSHLPVSWHFIGHLQTNKARYAVRMFDLIHTVDSEKLGAAIDAAAGKIGKVQDVLVQVNISREATKSGVGEDAAESLVRALCRMPHLSVKGLMTMPPFFDDPERARPFFRRLAALAERIRGAALPRACMEALSMGMTGDFEAAIEEGATLVRVGTAIFGERR